MKNNKIGSIAFVVGLVLAIIIALVSARTVPVWAVILLAVIGLIVGFLNVSDNETHGFLVAAIAFLLSFGALSTVIEGLAFGWDAVGAFFNLMTIFIAPATAVIALRALFDIGKN